MRTPKRGKRKQGRNGISYIEMLKKNTELDDIYEIKMQMLNQDKMDLFEFAFD